MACEGCNSKSIDMAQIPYAAHESAMSRAMRVIKWLVIALVATVILLFASNGLWLWYLSGYDVESCTEIEAQQDGEGINIAGGGNINYGANSQNTQDNAQS